MKNCIAHYDTSYNFLFVENMRIVALKRRKLLHIIFFLNLIYAQSLQFRLKYQNPPLKLGDKLIPVLGWWSSCTCCPWWRAWCLSWWSLITNNLERWIQLGIASSRFRFCEARKQSYKVGRNSYRIVLVVIISLIKLSQKLSNFPDLGWFLNFDHIFQSHPKPRIFGIRPSLQAL